MENNTNDISSAREMKANTRKAIEEAVSRQQEKQHMKDVEYKVRRNKWFMMGVLFIIAAGIIVYIFPSKGKFKYSYELKKPWMYETLTSPMPFGIEKSNEELDKEYAAIIAQQFIPYYTNNDSIRVQILKEIDDKCNNMGASKQVRNYLKDNLSYIYRIGIISADELLDIKKRGITQIRIRHIGEEGTEAVYEAVDIDLLYTTKKAYEAVISNAPEYVEKDKLRAMNINELFCNDLSYDRAISESELNDIKGQISTITSYVQEGQLIISHGDIVTEKELQTLNSLKHAYEINDDQNASKNIFAGQILCVLGILVALYLYMVLFRERFISFKNVCFILSMIIGLCALTSLVVRLGRDNSVITPYIIPYAMLPITISTFFDTRTALFTHLTTVLLCSIICSHEFDFLLLQIIIGMISISTLKHLFQRAQLIKSACIIVCVYTITYIGLTLLENGDWKKEEDTVAISSFLINGGLLTLAYPFIYIMEKMFNFTSDVTLVELANTNNPLLRNLSENAPGTFNHALQVANLSSDAATSIGANPMLARAGALYHDIGKLTNPIFFTENQHGFNPHQFIDEKESVTYILKHVTDGLSIARKNNLPKSIQEFIETHHGQNVVRSFYNAYSNKHPNEEVNEKDFSYPGKLPTSKETVIVMICDSVEAASRSLKEYTSTAISNLVDSIVNTQLHNGAFREAPITLKEIEIVKSILKEKLMNIYHTRVQYPELLRKKKEN